MKIFAAMAISAGLIAGPMLAESHDKAGTDRKTTSSSSRGLEEAKTLTPQSLSQAVAFEKAKVARAEREAKMSRSKRSSGEVSADYVGPSANATSSADRMVQDENETQVQSPGAKEYEDQKQDHPTR